MIDEKKLMEEARRLLFNSEILSPGWHAINKMLEVIERQPKVAEWIPVEERLPDEEAKEFIKEHLSGIGYLYPCLLTYRSPNTEKINVVRFYYDLYQNWFVNLGEEPCEKDRCLAWQPLPEPWEGGDEVELNRRLGETMVKFLNERNLQPTCFKVINVEQVARKEGEEE